MSESGAGNSGELQRIGCNWYWQLKFWTAAFVVLFVVWWLL